MKHFRQKLVVILLESNLNKLKGYLIYYQSDDEENLFNSDVVLLKNSTDGVEDKRPLSISIRPTDPHELVVGLYNYIMSIDEAEFLE